MHTCYICGQPCDEENYCFGCRECICDSCTQNYETAGFNHAPEDHTRTLDEDEYDLAE